MAVNVNQLTAMGSQYTYWAVNTNGYPDGTSATTIASGSNSGMGRLKSVTKFGATVPESPRNVVLGDNGVVGQFLGQPQTLPTGELTTTVFDQTFQTVANGQLIYADGDFDQSGLFPACYTYKDLFFVMNSPAQNFETAAGAVGSSGWLVTEIWNANVQAMKMPEIATNATFSWSSSLAVKPTTVNPFGVTISSSNYGYTSDIGIQYFSDYPVTYHTLIGNAAVTTVTLNETPAAATVAGVQVYINGVKKAYTTDYTVNTTTKVVTLVAAPAAAAKVIIRYKFVPAC